MTEKTKLLLWNLSMVVMLFGGAVVGGSIMGEGFARDYRATHPVEHRVYFSKETQK